MSKVIRSRNDWKQKAIQRANIIRENRKYKKQAQNKIAELKQRVHDFEQSKEIDKASSALPVGNVMQAQTVRTLCVLLVIEAVISYRSIPRILKLFDEKTSLNLGWVPHFTSVINWSLRVGLGLLKQVKSISEPWIAIIDHSIDIGTKKAMVVLRVTIKTLSQKKGAIQLKDCECIGLEISEKVNGESISEELEGIFNQSGNPVAILKDCDATLQKGVRLWSKEEELAVNIPVIDDIGHVMASALKSEFAETKAFKHFTACTNQGARCLRQTDLAFLMPPKLRTKGRFQSISKLGKWAANMLNILSADESKDKSEKDEGLLARFRKALPGFRQLSAFIGKFSRTTTLVSQVMKILKTEGLNQESYETCTKLAETLPRNSRTRKCMLAWLKKHIKIQKEITTVPLLVSSDIIESLFGSFKHMNERGPQADMNRSILLIPTLCGNRSEQAIMQALNMASQSDLKKWEEENIPYTMRKRRHKFFSENISQKPGEACLV